MRRTLSILAVVLAVAAAGFFAWRQRPGAPHGRLAHTRKLATLPSIDVPATWWNGFVADYSLRGHPVVVLLWSDADPRAPAALATLQAWHTAYAPLGVQVLALHVPEYAYGADTAVAGRFVRRERLTLPVATDPDGRFAAAFGGATDGPHLVVADESGVVLVDAVAALAPGDEALHAWALREHPDSAPPRLSPPPFPAVRVVRLGAGEVREGPMAGLPAGSEQVFTAEFRYQEHGRDWTPFPVGGWRVGADGLAATRGGAANFTAIRYSAGRAGVVVSPPPGAHARLWVLLDDHWPREDRRGADVVAGQQGAVYLDVTAPGLYWIEQGRGERVLKLSPDQSGITLHALVFEGARE
jgi:hypothetical protein